MKIKYFAWLKDITNIESETFDNININFCTLLYACDYSNHGRGYESLIVKLMTRPEGRVVNEH